MGAAGGLSGERQGSVGDVSRTETYSMKQGENFPHLRKVVNTEVQRL